MRTESKNLKEQNWSFKNSQVAVGPMRTSKKCRHEFILDYEYLLSCKYCGIIFDSERRVLETRAENKAYYRRMMNKDKIAVAVMKKFKRRKHGKKLS